MNSFLYFRLHPSAFYVLVDPFAEQCRLSKASGRGDERHAGRDTQSPVQPLEKARTRDELWSSRRNVELGG